MSQKLSNPGFILRTALNSIKKIGTLLKVYVGWFSICKLISLHTNEKLIFPWDEFLWNSAEFHNRGRIVFHICLPPFFSQRLCLPCFLGGSNPATFSCLHRLGDSELDSIFHQDLLCYIRFSTAKNKVKAPSPGDLKHLQGKGLWSVEQVWEKSDCTKSKISVLWCPSPERILSCSIPLCVIWLEAENWELLDTKLDIFS